MAYPCNTDRYVAWSEYDIEGWTPKNFIPHLENGSLSPSLVNLPVLVKEWLEWKVIRLEQNVQEFTPKIPVDFGGEPTFQKFLW